MRTDHHMTEHGTTNPMRTLDERRQWRQTQWTRRNRSSAWLIDDAMQAAGTTQSFVKPLRPARCGWPIGRTSVQLVDGKASVRNLEHCASPWSCPVCSTIIRAQRANDLQHAADTWNEQGHGLLFATLTRPHTKTEPLAVGMDIVTDAWKDITKSVRWRVIRRTHGITHWAKTIEITWSPTSGWHVHIHLLAFTEDPAPDARRLQTDLYELWDGAVQRHGGKPVSRRHGVKVLPVKDTPGRVGRYMVKPPDRIGSEITRLHAQTCPRASLSPSHLLDQPAIDRIGENKANTLWLEYVTATRGQNSVTWSRHLRAELVGTPEQTDRQIIDNTLQGVPILEIPNQTYRQLKREPSVLGFILSRIETGEVPLAETIIDNTVTKDTATA